MWQRTAVYLMTDKKQRNRHGGPFIAVTVVWWEP
jgi:hypothetical protein